MALALTALVFFTLVGCTVAVWVVRKTGRVLSFQALVIVNYTAMYLSSGIVHILGLGARRGYFDVVRALEPSQIGQVVLIQGVGLIGLCAGMLATAPGVDRANGSEVRTLSRFDRAWLPLVVALVFPVSLVALLRIREYARALEVFGGRIISVDGGMARYVFVSHWFVWAVSLSVIWLAFGPLRRSARWSLAVTLAGLVLIVASLAWNGGRSIAVVFTLPLILVMIPLLRKSQAFASVAMVVGVLALILYVSWRSSERTAALRAGSGNAADWLDWEWGRFSMVGFAVDYVDESGYLFGETIINSFGRILGFLSSGSIDARSATEIAGVEIFNRSAARFLAPGFSVEMYLNLGLLGIFFGYFLIGWACRKIDWCFLTSNSLVVQLFWAYFGTLVVFRVLPSEPGSLLQGLLFSGLPLLVAAFFSHLSSRRSSHPATIVNVDERAGEGAAPLEGASRGVV